MTATSETIEREPDLDIRTLLVILWARRWWTVSSIVFCVLIFAVVAFVMTPVYRATVVMVPATAEQSNIGALGSALGQLGGLASLAGINLTPGGSNLEESLAILRSRRFTESFILDEQILPALLSRRWSSVVGRWVGRTGKDRNLNEAYRYFDRRVRAISQDRRTGLVYMHIEWTDPEAAAYWANELIARLNADVRRRAIDKAAASLEYLEKELAATAVIGTREAINRLMEAQINQGMFANVTEEYALRVIDAALAPDLSDPIRPRRALLLALAVVLGAFLGCLLAVIVPHETKLQRPTAVDKN